MNWAMSQNESVDSWWQDYFTNEYSEEKQHHFMKQTRHSPLRSGEADQGNSVD